MFKIDCPFPFIYKKNCRATGCAHFAYQLVEPAESPAEWRQVNEPM